MAKWTFTSNVLNMPRQNEWKIVISAATRKEVGGELVTVPEKAIQFRKGLFSTDSQEEYDFLVHSDFGKKNYKNTYMLLEDAARIRAAAPGPAPQINVGPPVKPIPMQRPAVQPEDSPLNRDEIRVPEAPIVRAREDAEFLAEAQGGVVDPVAPEVVAGDFARGGEAPVKTGRPKRESEISKGEEEEVASASPAAKALAGGAPPVPEAPLVDPGTIGAMPSEASAPQAATAVDSLTWPQLKAKGRELGLKVVGISKADLQAEIKLKLAQA